MYALDTTHPDVLDHLATSPGSLVEMGFTYIKLDFTFAPVDTTASGTIRPNAGRSACGPVSTRSVAARATTRSCSAAARRLSHVVGVVDGNRIGPDVAPLWELDPSAEVIPGYLRTQPSTKFADDATVIRAFMHRRLWLNDPDCLMLRTDETDARRRPMRSAGPNRRRCRAAWRWCPTTWPCSTTRRRGPAARNDRGRARASDAASEGHGPLSARSVVF